MKRSHLLYAVVLVCALCQSVMSFLFNVNFASQLTTTNHPYILLISGRNPFFKFFVFSYNTTHKTHQHTIYLTHTSTNTYVDIIPNSSKFPKSACKNKHLYSDVSYIIQCHGGAYMCVCVCTQLCIGTICIQAIHTELFMYCGIHTHSL